MTNFVLSEKTGLLHAKSQNKVSRRGNILRSRCTVNQALKCGDRGGKFIAVIFDPDTRERLQEIVIWHGQPSETVELTVEWERDTKEP